MLIGNHRLPDFLVIGAAKSGTTSLFHYLSQHPRIFFPPMNKEPGFFCFSEVSVTQTNYDSPVLWSSAITDLVRYAALFSSAPDASLIGEATPEYLLLPNKTISALENTYGHDTPQLKFIALLRNPIERIWSHYWMMRRDGFENLEYKEAVAESTIKARLSTGWHPAYDYLGYGMYGEQVTAYVRHFGRDSVRLIVFDKFRADPVKVCQDLYGFLGLDPTFIPDVSTKHNVSGALKHPLLHRLLFTRERTLKSLARRLLPHAELQRLKARVVAWNTRPVAMPEAERIRLTAYYRDDVLRLSCLTGLDLSHWLKQ
jgi:hypothetical protein